MLNEILDPWVKARMGLEEHHLADMETYHRDCLKAVLTQAIEKSPYYKKYDKGLAFEDLPFVSQEDIRDHGLSLLCTSQSQIQRVTTLETSGTTGVPKRIYATEADLINTIAYFKVGMGTFTCEGEKVLILLPGEREGGIGRQLYAAVAQLGAVPIAHGVVTNLKETFECMKAHQPQVVVGIPAQVLALAKYGLYTGQNLSCIQKVLLSTDRSPDCGISLMKEIWDCEIFRYYGMTEAGFGWGLECEHHKGYHLYESDFYTEIIDPVTGKVLPSGQEGEVVLTTLKREGMPLIRYRTGDISKLMDTPCSCGSKLKRLGPIEGRVQGTVTLKNGRTFNRGDLEDVLTPLLRLVEFTASVQKGSEKDSLSVTVYYWGVLPEKETLMRKFSKVSAIEDALNQNLLTLNLSLQQVYSDFCPTPHKRIIHQEG